MNPTPLPGRELEMILGTTDYTAWNESIDSRFLILLKYITELRGDVEASEGRIDDVAGRIDTVENAVNDLQDQIDIEYVGRKRPIH